MTHEKQTAKTHTNHPAGESGVEPDKFNSSHPANARHRSAMAPYETADLRPGRRAGIAVRDLRPLIPADKARAVTGINGDILATVTFPGTNPDEPPKEVALVDFGEDASEEHPVPVFVHDGVPMGRIMGNARTRYGLHALNYTPKEHMASYVPVADGSRMVLGSSNSRESYALGLSDQTLPGNELIDDDHAAVAFANGVFGVEDLSAEGVRITVAAEQRLGPADIAPEQVAGSLALLGEINRAA